MDRGKRMCHRLLFCHIPDRRVLRGFIPGAGDAILWWMIHKSSPSALHYPQNQNREPMRYGIGLDD
jgi:hypothetical protein